MANGPNEYVLKHLTLVERSRQALEVRKSRAESAKLAAERNRQDHFVEDGYNLAQKIYQWAKEFVASALGKRMLALCYGTEPVQMIVFYAGQGWKKEVAMLSIRVNDGVLGYSGCDYRGRHINNQAVDEPMTLAQWCSPDNLAKAWQLIASGEVYDNLLYNAEVQQSFLETDVERAEKDNT